MAGRLTNKVALITGASRGIGRATALAFAREGASVVVNYISRRDAAEEVVRQISEGGGQAAAVQADVSKRSEVDALVAQSLECFDRIDLLVNNAGIGVRASTLTMTEADFDRLMAVNVKGVIHCVQAVAPGMMERRSGRIVNVSSLAGLGTALPETTPYAATKAALIGLTKRFAFDLGPYGITVNTVCPGFIQTDMTGGPGGRSTMAAERSILGRVGQPEEVAAALLFLVSDEASFITAQVLAVDGGRMDFLSRSA